jgi:hypothetical protein
MLLAGVFLLLPQRDDGLDWVRKYGGKEKSGGWDTIDGSGSSWTSFEFVDPPPGLAREARSRARSIDVDDGRKISGQLDDTWMMLYEGDGISFTRQFTWLEKMSARLFPRDELVGFSR